MSESPGIIGSFAKQWLLARQLTDLDQWPPECKALNSKEQTLCRLNWSIQWHTLAHRQAARWYTGLKGIQIFAAATIPVLTSVGGNSLATKGWIAGLGALVVIVEGIQQLKKYASNALLWGQGKEALKQEYYLYEARVTPYSGKDAEKVLAKRIEQIIGREIGKWAGSPPEEDSHTSGGTGGDDEGGPDNHATPAPANVSTVPGGVCRAGGAAGVHSSTLT